MITAGQLRAARALFGVDQRKPAESAGRSPPTIRRMETSEGVVRGTVDSLIELVAALDARIERISDSAVSGAGRGMRFKGSAS